MTYNVFGGTLSLTQSINQSSLWGALLQKLYCRKIFYISEAGSGKLLSPIRPERNK